MLRCFGANWSRSASVAIRQRSAPGPRAAGRWQDQDSPDRCVRHGGYPSGARATAAAKDLRRVLRRKSSESPKAALAAAERTSLAGFASGLRRDADAVQAALELPWTTSPVEGQINRLKLIERTIYGRAGFALLRARVLHAA
jgi:hypothetical protein